MSELTDLHAISTSSVRQRAVGLLPPSAIFFERSGRYCQPSQSLQRHKRISASSDLHLQGSGCLRRLVASVMSTATTTTVEAGTPRSEPASLRELLRAYDIHQSGSEQQRHTADSYPHVELPTLRDVETTEQEHLEINSRRGIPPYRPVDPSANWSNRPASYSNGEAALVTLMFVGVYINGVRCFEWTSLKFNS
jgi:hypothetical protein